MLGRGLIRWLQFLRRPRWLLLILVLAGGSVFAGIHGWAWYHFHAGHAALARYQNEPARGHFQQALRVWPRSALVHLLAARAERRAGQWRQAEHHLDECRKSADPDVAAEAAFEWSLLRAAMGDLRTVEEALQARILSRPGDAPLIWEALADGYRHSYRMPEALQCLDTWLHFEPDNSQAYFLRGELHRQVGAVNRARAEYRQVVDLNPAHDEARRQLARCLVQIGRYQEAAEHLEFLLRKTPGDPHLRTLLARSQHDLGQRDEAVRLLDAVLRDHPDHGLALRERARLALAAEKFADAETWFRQALRALPYNYEASWGLHQALQGQGKGAEAKAQLAHAQQLKNGQERIHEIQTHQMTLRPFDAALHGELGELLIQTGQVETGEHWLRSALHLDPNLSGPHAALARLYEDRGDSTRAAHHHREAERLKAPPTK